MTADGSANGSENKWIGKRTIRPDGEDKVTGRASFAADHRQPGMLIGKMVRSPHPHAVIKSINVAEGVGPPGREGRDDGQRDFVEFPWDKPVPLGIQDLRYNRSQRDGAGEGAVCRAPGRRRRGDIARRSRPTPLKLIEVDYEVLPWVIDVDEALLPGAPILHEHMAKRRRQAGPARRHRTSPARSSTSWATSTQGSPPPTSSSSAASRPSPCTRATSSRMPASSASPRTATPTIWSSSQGHFMVRDMTAQLTGLKLSDVRAIPAEIGGGFGGKTIVYLEPVALVLSRKSGRPSRWS